MISAQVIKKQVALPPHPPLGISYQHGLYCLSAVLRPSYCKALQDMIGMIGILAQQLAGVDKCCTAI